MHKNARRTSALLCAAFIAVLTAGTATACRVEARPVIKYQSFPRAVFRSNHTRQADRITTGSIEKRATTDDEKKRVEDCMAIWDAGTHMTKTQWRRTCNSLLGEY